MSVYSNIPGTKSEKYDIKMIWEDNKTNCSKCNKYLQIQSIRVNHIALGIVQRKGNYEFFI